MTDQSDKPKLGTRPPLGLKRTVETGKVKQSFSHGRSNTVVVEVKKRRILGKPGEAPAPVEEKKAEAPAPAPKPAAPAPKAPPQRKLSEAEEIARRKEELERLQREAAEARMASLEEARRREDRSKQAQNEDEKRRAEDNRTPSRTRRRRLRSRSRCSGRARERRTHRRPPSCLFTGPCAEAPRTVATRTRPGS
jgi:translation initiation factor IF-2